MCLLAKYKKLYNNENKIKKTAIHVVVFYSNAKRIVSFEMSL